MDIKEKLQKHIPTIDKYEEIVNVDIFFQKELEKDILIIDSFEKFINENVVLNDEPLKAYLINLENNQYNEKEMIIAANKIIEELGVFWIDLVKEKMRRNVILKKRHSWETMSKSFYEQMFREHLFKYCITNELKDLVDLIILLMFILFLEKSF